MNPLMKILMKEDKRYLKELIQPINEKYILLENDMQFLKKDITEIKNDYKSIKQDMKNQLLAYIGLTISVIGIAAASYISTTNRIDFTNKRIGETNDTIYQMQLDDLMRDQRLYETVNEIDNKLNLLYNEYNPK